MNIIHAIGNNVPIIFNILSVSTFIVFNILPFLEYPFTSTSFVILLLLVFSIVF